MGYALSLALAVKARESAHDLDPAMGQAPLFLHASALTGDYDQVAALLRQSVDLNRKIGDQGMVAAELQNLAFVETHRGNVDVAERCLAKCEKLGSATDPYGIAMTSLTWAMVAFARGDKNRSQTLLQHAKSIPEEAKIDAGPDDQFEFNWLQGLLERNSRIDVNAV